MNNIDKVLNMFTKYSNDIPIIITTKEQFAKVDGKYRGFNNEYGLNTYKGYLVELREQMPKNNEIIIMDLIKYINLLKYDEMFL